VRALLLIELDALRPGAGATVVRLAAKARALDVVPIAAACCLHDARPTFAEAYEACVARGASEVTLVPYAITVSPAAAAELHRLRAAAERLYPGVVARLAEPLGAHPAVAQVVMQRAAEADYVAAHPFLAEHAGYRADVAQALRPLYLPYPELPSADERPAAEPWRPMYAAHSTAMLLAAAGPMTQGTSRPLYAIAEQIRRRRRYAAVRVCFAADGQPSLAATLAELAGRAIRHALAVPCTLQHGDPLIAQLASEADALRERDSSLTLLVAEHLTYDRRLVEAIGDRAHAAVLPSLPVAS
jgi:sirohydrochlorin cobaltochelatase